METRDNHAMGAAGTSEPASGKGVGGGSSSSAPAYIEDVEMEWTFEFWLWNAIIPFTAGFLAAVSPGIVLLVSHFRRNRKW